MDQQIISLLQERSQSYEREYLKLPNKNDPAAVFEHECIYYLEPLSKYIIPILAQRLIENKKEKLELYLPYIFKRYHESVIKDIENYKHEEDSFSKRLSKEVISSYSDQVLIYKSKSEKEKEDFLLEFIRFHNQTLEQISEKSPHICIETIAKLRTPQLQYCLFENKNIREPIHDLLIHEWLVSDWSKWLDKYFCYPRTTSIDEYFSKWVGREAIHIKICKPIFDSYYDQAKIWLKNMEKRKEKK